MVEKVVVFGYSDNPDRYSFKAFNMLRDFKHEVTAFNPRTQDIMVLNFEFDTLTMYVSEAISNNFFDQILHLKFQRVIFNPGAENPKLEEALSKRGCEIVHGCTLVMLKTNQF